MVDLIGVYNQVSSGMKMNLSAMDVLKAISKGYGLIAGGADFVEFAIPQRGTYAYGTIGDSSSALDVRWKSNCTKFHELLNQPAE